MSIFSHHFLLFQILLVSILIAEEQQDLTQQIKTLSKTVVNSSNPDIYLEEVNKLLEYNQSNPQLLYARSYIYEHQKEYNKSLDDLALSLKSNSPYKMKGIAKLKQLCTEICDYHCNKKIEEKYFGGKDGYHKLNQLIEDRDIAIESQDIQQLTESSQKCTRDVPLYSVLLTKQLSESLFVEAQNTISKLKQISNINNNEIQKIQDAITIIQSLNNFQFSQQMTDQIQQMNTIPEELKNQLIQFYNGLKVTHELINVNTPITNKPSQLNERINNCTNELQNSDITQIIMQLQNYCQKNIEQLKQIDLTHIINDFYSWKELIYDYLKVYNIKNTKNTKDIDLQTIKDSYNQYQHPNLLALKGITISLNLLPQIDQLQQEYYKSGLVDFELEELQNKLEQTRKILNKALFTQKNKEETNIKQLLDDCNQIFGKLVQVQILAMNPNCYQLLNVSQNATQSEMKKAYFKSSRVFHPDQYPQNITQEEKKRRQRMFQKIAEAYDILSNEEKRKIWEQGKYNQQDIQQLINIYQTRVQASYTVPPDYEGTNEGISDEELKKYMTDEQWYEYQKQRRRQAVN